MTKTKHFLRGL